MKFLCSTLFALALATSQTFAWNAAGHRIVSELAWRELSAGQRHTISDLLRQHPHYALLLATNFPAHVDTNEWVFLNASVWPDMIRPSRRGDREKPAEITKYHRSQWHYINLPYVLPANAGHLSASSFSVPETNVLWALTNTLDSLKRTDASAADRAVSLCWLLHLVGDLHQPLHAATLLSDTYTNGDMGGNSLAIADASQRPLNLHAFWDDLLYTCDGYDCVTMIADHIANASQFNPRNLKEYKEDKTIRSWADESYTAAVAFAYAEGHLRFADWRDYESGKITAADVPRLTSAYVINASDIARRRAALAGRRLADLLQKIF